jgi:Fe-S-cluster containining protein
MGEVIEIREQTGPSAFRIGFTVTGEEREVKIDPEREALWSRQGMKRRTLACPFLRELETGAVICTVHRSRPDLCRQYSCFRILVLDGEGKKIGRVVDGTRYFDSGNAGLKEIWDQDCAGLDITDEDGWEEAVENRVVSAGYRIVR